MTMMSAGGCGRNPEYADLIFMNGTVFTGTEKGVVQSVAIRGETILDTGTDEEMLAYRDSSTVCVDLHKAFACAGFNDAHLHLVMGGLNMLQVDLTGVTTVREMQRRVANAIHTTQPGAWIVGWGWDQNLFKDKQWPDRKALDVIAPDIPIFLKRVCGHAVLVNTKALRIANITRQTPDPAGGEIMRDSRTGRATGIIKETAIELVEQYIPEPPEDQEVQAVRKALSEFRRLGITSVQDNTSGDILKIYRDLQEKGELTCRISEMVPYDTGLDRCEKLRAEYTGDFLRFGLIKEFADGSLGARSAAMIQPYLDDPSNSGLARYSQEDLNAMVAEADRRGFQMGIHAIGNRANAMVLDAYEYARNVNGPRDARHRIEHSQILTKNDVSRFADMGVVASMQPFHCIGDLHWVESVIGKEQCRYAYAWQSLVSAGAPVAFGTDWPVVPLNPLESIYAAVTRQDTSGFPAAGWHREERLTPEQALAAYTAGSAYAEFMEHKKGVLAKGMLADIVVLDRNILDCDPLKILETRVVYTLVGGSIVYSAGQ